MDATLAALLITLVIDIISKVRATRADNESTRQVAEAVGELKGLAAEMQKMHVAIQQRFELLEARVEKIESGETENPLGRSGTWRH